ncbi:thiosulfate oxidation carrier complex protein SoxZ [Thermus thermamylovorans]|uniref:Thiosulfate oxidation carrier complex protein SoxZ n=1 Tax=Thermus thermamylovorans TaxID=2509362 RepID=A0A4V2IUJ5_9DEIN|nr:thiosulfate oxidation carrier complex protein SoxZ [Thermus thermamylovorans]TBH17234.1 thiosulfate oxidation carrier complex protein SoxZ [Thermus thermamylovorans]
MAIRVIVRLNPARPKAGEEFRLQAVAQHPNHPGTTRDAQGNLIPANYINLVEVLFEGEKVAEARPGPSTSANPLYGFKFRAERPGTFTVRLRDLSGDTGEGTTRLELA